MNNAVSFDNPLNFETVVVDVVVIVIVVVVVVVIVVVVVDSLKKLLFASVDKLLILTEVVVDVIDVFEVTEVVEIAQTISRHPKFWPIIK